MLWIINWNLKLPAGTFINSKSMWCDDQIIDNKHQNKNQDGLPTWDSSNCFVVNWLTSSSVFDVPTHPTISSISATYLWEDTKTFYIKKQMMSLIVPFPDAKHRMKSTRIQSFSGSYYSAFGLNTERYVAPLPIHSKREKIRTRNTPNTY